MPRALISVSDKTGLLDFARGLVARGYDLVSTGGTAKVLAESGLPVLGVSDVTGFPEMMDGRVKTLHPMVHGGILARRGRPDDLAAASRHGITLIDLVVVNLYPFVQAAANPGTPFEGLIEEIDIGGPSLVRGAAKNFQDVLVVVAPADYPDVLDQLDRSGGPTREFRFALARKAFAHTGSYDVAIASTLETVAASDAGFTRGGAPALPAFLGLGLTKIRDLRYGENPHQAAAWYAEQPASGLGAATVLQGKELSYTNLLDLDAAARIVLEFSEPAAAVIKHTNPCGAATGATAADAGRELRSIVGAVLVQSRDRVIEAASAWPRGDMRVVTRRQPSPEEWEALRFAWRICAHVKSNTVIFTGADRTLAIGAGQMSRVDAVKVARMKAEAIGPDALNGSVAASDAFFPFRDGLDAVASAGATAVIQPGGSVRDQEVIAAADERGLAMVFTGRRHFRH